MSKNSFSELLDACDEIIEGKPTEGNLGRLLSLIEDQTLKQYVFQKLNNPEWIMPLSEKGLFKSPPEPIIDSRNDRISYPNWNELEFLFRMAEQVPEVVSKVVLEIPLIDNVIVHTQIIRIALSLSHNYSVEVAEKEIEWLKKQNNLFFSPYSIDCGQLISYLSKYNYYHTALELARNILGIFSDLNSDKEGNKSSFFSRDPRTKIGLWEYEQILQKNIPDLIEVNPMPTVELFCELLNDSIEITNENREGDGDEGEDYSYIWRPDIEHKNHSDIKDLLVLGTLKSCKQIVELRPNAISEVISLLENYRWKIFLRLSMYLIANSSGDLQDLIENYLVNKNFFNDSSIRNEYATLAQNHFSKLTPASRNIFLQWIEDGPPTSFDKYVERSKQMFEVDKDKNDYEEYVTRWKWERLEPIKNSLSPEWKEKYDSYTRVLDNPKPFTNMPIVAHFVSEKSPKSFEDLKEFDIEELIKYLKEWEPSGEFDTPSKQGLANTISSIAFSESKIISENSMRFIELDLIYINSIVSGLRKAVKDEKYVDWEKSLNLCLFFIEKIYLDKESEINKSQYVNAIKREIASLLQAGYKPKSSEIPREFREISWKILAPLTNDSQPTSEYEKTYGGENMDPATLSLNTIRGEAMHTVFQYSLWVRRIFENSENSQDLVNAGFEMMPEVKEVLKSHLEIDKDSSLAVRSVYGQWYPWLVLIDSKWSKEHSDVIFPKDDTFINFFNVAWDSYIQFCAPYDSVFDTIEETYKFAVTRLNFNKKELQKRPYTSEQRLAEHLMSLYWRGKVEISEHPDQILNVFYSKASPELLNHAISFVGRSLKNTKDEIPEKFINRLVKLWEYRFGTIRKLEYSEQNTKELVAFGWWFLSEKFEISWSINQLKSVIELESSIEPNSLVIERLESVSSEYSLEVVECIRFLIKGENDPLKMLVIQDSVYNILQKSINSEKQKVQDLTIDIIERLLANGYFRFRELLPKEK